MPHITANGVRTYYERKGSGPAVLLISGNGMEHTAFHEQVPAFSKHFTCITYDMRGIGASDVPADGYTTKEMARDALALLTAIGIESAHVGGYSLGGAIGQEMAIAEPERIKSLSLYSSFDKADPYLKLRYAVLQSVLAEAGPELWAMFTAFSAFGPNFINTHEAEIWKEIKQRASRWNGPGAPDKIGLSGHYNAITTHDASARLVQIGCPTWIAVGSDDPVTPVSYAERLHRNIKASRMQVFAGRPHRILNFQAEDFTQAALAFLLEQS
jgi:3-oxoadipate enol-lactonase